MSAPLLSADVLFALGKNDVDPVVRQDEAAGAGLGRDFGRDGAHAGGQDRRHEARSVGLDQLRLPDRLARDERRARDRAGDLLCASGRSLRRMKLLLAVAAGQVCHWRSSGLDRLAKADVGLRNQNVHGLHLRNRSADGVCSSDPLARYAATPPAPRAMVRTTIRAVFIRFTIYFYAGRLNSVAASPLSMTKQ